jgi:pimeloyl-ACP methyl ester carboxylesterase
MSDMSGTKAAFLAETCAAAGRGFVRFDYSGCGLSGGVFTEGTIGRWREDALAVLDRALPPGPVVLVGSSMGGWLALSCALARPERVAGIVGIAAAPDFTRDLLASLSPDERARLMAEGRIEQPSAYGAPYVFTRALLEEGERHALLGGGPIPITCPVRLLHGLDDADVPWRLALAIADQLTSADVEVTLVKAGDHRLSKPRELALLAATLERLLAALETAPACAGGPSAGA